MNDGPGNGLDVDLLDGLEANRLWQLGGNSGTVPGTDYLGTSDDQAVEIKVNGQRAFRVEPDSVSPNLVGGSSGNITGSAVQGVVIGGGGELGAPNQAHGSFTTVSGREGNINESDASWAIVQGGRYNTAGGASSLAWNACSSRWDRTNPVHCVGFE
jgi:hypothetical protein